MLYAEALSAAQDDDDAWRRCTQIQSLTLRGDCQVAVMDAWSAATPERCAEIAAHLWRDECTFLAAEQLWASGDHVASIAACEQTRFVRQCAWHLLQDEAEAAADLSPVDAERRMRPLLGAVARLPDAGMQFWALWFRLQARAGRPVDGEACASLEQGPLCLDGLDRYLHDVLSAQQRAGRSVCDGKPVQGWVYSVQVQDSVQRWLAHHCRD